MGLTATSLVLAVGLLAAGALVASVCWAWPRLTARTLPAMLGRVGVLAGNQVLTLMVLGLVMNNYFGFYGSWSDLFGTGSRETIPLLTDAGPAPAAPGERARAGVRVLATAPVGPASKDKGLPAGQIQQVVVAGASSGLSSLAYVYLPPHYFQKQHAETRFPVIVALTGYPGDARNLITRMNMPAVAAAAIDRGEMPPTILVLMRPTVAPPRDTECMDVPRGPQVETYFTKDLKESMATAYRVGADAPSWGILGGSTGGYCALKLSMRHPEAYSAAVSLSGYFKPPVDPTTGDLFGGSRSLRNENDLMWRLAHLPPPPVSVLVATSEKGESNYEPTLEFLDAVRPPMRASSLILRSGGHNFTTWSRELPQALPWLAQRLRPPGTVPEPGSPTGPLATPSGDPRPTPSGDPRPTPSGDPGRAPSGEPADAPRARPETSGAPAF
ncbi:alpha/beta hydrolase-fold protein [Sphaerisporangium sp. TRM90804]|uniref:alpha/beta hydrolase n=1 Tax=Sphaerisporangium sp. TRM90804 TaxID=3031113 RepID=UPI002446D670|nr:alpha/beta hydrolase-fold protein [Sphaerisporangium sp. TRM90804]MDH2425233.1 alpha/beta hydrolase-fold protein [Sphaerisporangium sp. TRM90804]